LLAHSEQDGKPLFYGILRCFIVFTYFRSEGNIAGYAQTRYNVENDLFYRYLYVATIGCGCSKLNWWIATGRVIIIEA